MTSESLIARLLAWVREGYPQGVPQQDYVPLVALLRRQVSRDEATHIAETLVAEGRPDADRTDIGVQVTKVLDDLPSEDDIARVERRLARLGANDVPDGEGGVPGSDQRREDFPA